MITIHLTMKESTHLLQCPQRLVLIPTLSYLYLPSCSQEFCCFNIKIGWTQTVLCSVILDPQVSFMGPGKPVSSSKETAFRVDSKVHNFICKKVPPQCG